MYPIRKELVGKRFMCVADKTQNGRPNSRSNRASNPLDYAWRCGIIRACTEEDSDNIDQKVRTSKTVEKTIVYGSKLI